MKVYSVFDQESEIYSSPVVLDNAVDARRWIVHQVLLGNFGAVLNYPDRFTIYEIAKYDPRSGSFEKVDVKPIGNVLSLMSSFALESEQYAKRFADFYQKQKEFASKNQKEEKKEDEEEN